MALTLLSSPINWILNIAICVLYPAYLTFMHLYHGVLHDTPKDGAEDPRMNSGLIAHYIQYWTIYVLFVKLEAYALSYVVPYIPFFYEAKLVTFYWLGSDHFKGAGYLFHRYVMKNMMNMVKVLRNEMDTKLDARHRKTIIELSHHLGSVDDVKFTNME
ncbi:uncharacterized protein BXIN_0171 [Babesia sp. Xinjiang]|uniref:uncharacterized protein n=1 Tax=Babesia sp. Xinjiang TaxID=462227 RepID=UPI000A22BA4D|nr:uncharacterized protein BXIN_0171 [Babesia sp. Xinjiang]ORM39806.1 hypothetical protein BXIN_0171 [Babesia sp. Xinjiang]